MIASAIIFKKEEYNKFKIDIKREIWKNVIM